MRRLVFVVIAAALVMAGCGGSNKDKETTTTTSSVVPTTASISPTTAGPAAPTVPSQPNAPTTTAAAPAIRGEVEALRASEEFLKAWRNSDVTGAQRVAEPDAVNTLFRNAYKDGKIVGLQNRGCNTNARFNNQLTCSYEYDGGTMHFVMKQVNRRWVVGTTEFLNR